MSFVRGLMSRQESTLAFQIDINWGKLDGEGREEYQNFN